MGVRYRIDILMENLVHESTILLQSSSCSQMICSPPLLQSRKQGTVVGGVLEIHHHRVFSPIAQLQAVRL